MTSRERGPSHSSVRPPNGRGTTIWGRRGSGEEWEALYIEPIPSDRDYRSSRDSSSQGRQDVSDYSPHTQYYRPRHESNASLHSEYGTRQPRQGLTSPLEDPRLRVSPSPNRMYKEEGRPRPEHLNLSRDKQYYGSTDYQPPQFPQNPYSGSRPVSGSMEGQGSARGSRPGSRNQSPVPPYPSTPPLNYHRNENGSSERISSISGSRFADPPRTPENPYQLAPLKFSPPGIKDSLLGNTHFDDFIDKGEVKMSPPPPSRPPPAPPSRHPFPPGLSPRTLETPRSSTIESDSGTRITSLRSNVDEDWTMENVIEFLRKNGFSEPWQQAFRDARIYGDRFRACTSLREARKLVNIPQDTDRKLPRLITLIRKATDPDSDLQESETASSTSRPIPPIPPEKDRSPEIERRPIRSQTAPANNYVQSPEAASAPPLPPPRQFVRQNSEQPYTTYVSPATRPEVITQKAQPQPPRARSPLESKRPLSPITDPRQTRAQSQTPFLGQYNRHSKNMSNGSDLSDQSLRSVNQQTRSSQDFNDMISRLSKEGTIVPPKRVDKKKSHEQMSKPGLISRLFRTDKSKEVPADLDDDNGPLSPPLPPQPPYSHTKSHGMNNSQSSFDSSSLSTPIDDARASPLATSNASLSSLRPPSEISNPSQYTLPPVLWVQVTEDEDNFRRCDLSGVGPDPAALRERICQKFNLKPMDTALFITDILGTPDDSVELDDDQLLSECSRGDSRGTLKFLLKPHSRKVASPAKTTLPPIPQSLRPAQSPNMLMVPEVTVDGRDVRSTSLSEDPNRKGHYSTTPQEMYAPQFADPPEKDERRRKSADYFGNPPEELEGVDQSRSDPSDDVNTRVFKAAEQAKRNRERRKRTESGGSEKSTPLDETSSQTFTSEPAISPGGRRVTDSGFEKIWGGKEVPQQPSRQNIRPPARQSSLPVSPGSPGTFRILSRDPPDTSPSSPRASPYLPQQATFEDPSRQKLPTRTPSGIKAQRRAPAPPSFPMPPSRTATVVATQRYPEKPSKNGNHMRRLSDSQGVYGMRSGEDDQFSQTSPVLDRQKGGVADHVNGNTFAGIPMVIAPHSLHEPSFAPPRRAPSPGTPAAKAGIGLNTNLLVHTNDGSPPTEWQSSISPYSGLDSSVTRDMLFPEERSNPKPATAFEVPKESEFNESSNITFDDAPAFDLPDDDEEGSLWAVKPVGVEDKNSKSRQNSEDKGSGAPTFQRKSSLRQAGRGHRPSLTVQIDPKVTQIPDPQYFSAIPEEITSTLTSKRPAFPSNPTNGDHEKETRPDSPEFTVGDDQKGLNSPMRPPLSPATPTSSTPTGATDLTRKTSFARHEDVWAVRPPTDVVLNNLEEFFPNHDLDKPIVVDNNNSSPPVSPMDNSDSDTNGTVKPLAIAKPPKPQPVAVTSASIPLARPAGRMKSIRVVAKEAMERRRALEKRLEGRGRFATVANQVKNANLLRRRSTKVWGARMLEMTPGQVRLGQIITTDNDKESSERGLERRRTFKWVKGDLIGKGTYGSVYLGLNATTGEMFAVKQVEIAHDQDDERCKAMMDALNAEIETLKDLDHPYIVQYLGYERTDKTLSIFLEYVPGGSVGRCLKKHGRFEEKVIRSLIRQTLEGLAYLHSQGRLHRDLKADNLLIDLDGVCKISDFGISKQSKALDDVYANDHYTLAGTIFWMAPEVIQSQGGYSAKIDIWSLGCVVLEMFAGKRPWSTDEAIGAMFKLGNERKPPPIPEDVQEHMSPDAKDFLDKCFTIEAKERPTANVLLNHRFCEVDPNFNFAETKLGKAVRLRFGEK